MQLISLLILFSFLAERKAKLPEGADHKTMLPRKTLAKIRMFDSSISPSGLLERLVGRQLVLTIPVYHAFAFFHTKTTVVKMTIPRYKVRISGYKMGETNCDWIRTS